MTIQEHYQDLKAKHPDAVLLFRKNDFYIEVGEDAETCARELGITLTKGKDGMKQTMFPYHTIDTYLPRLIRAGHRVVITDL